MKILNMSGDKPDDNEWSDNFIKETYTASSTERIVLICKHCRKRVLTYIDGKPIKTTTLYNHMRAEHSNQFRHKKQKTIIDTLVFAGQAIKKLNWLHPLGIGRSNIGNRNFQDSILEFMIECNVPFNAVSNEAFWKPYKSLFHQHHRFSRQELATTILDKCFNNK